MIEKGTRFGSWSYDRFLFAGASGTVGLVHRTAAPFTVAVVKIHDGPKTTASRDEFLRERKFVEDQPLAGFMPEWYESGETADGTPWFVMQYAPRLPKKLGRKELKRVIDRVAAALQRLHRLGRLHCDVKRENIGLADGIAVLLDFGSLHRIAAARQHPERVGTWPNMAPEVRDALLLDIRADVYSLGCTFKGLCHRRDRRFFESLIVRATDNDPEKRPQTMRRDLLRLPRPSPFNRQEGQHTIAGSLASRRALLRERPLRRSRPLSAARPGDRRLHERRGLISSGRAVSRRVGRRAESRQVPSARRESRPARQSGSQKAPHEP